MAVHLYVVSVEKHRLVAAEVQDQAAAALLDAAQTVLLATAEDLGKVARRLRLPLVTIARSAGRPALDARPAADEVDRLAPARVCAPVGRGDVRGTLAVGRRVSLVGLGMGYGHSPARRASRKVGDVWTVRGQFSFCRYLLHG